MESKKVMLSKLEEMMNSHIKMYPDRHLPCTESSYILNEGAILKLATHYEGMFNENPVIQISSLPKRTYVEFKVREHPENYQKIVQDINVTLAKKYKNVLVKGSLNEHNIEKNNPMELK